MNTSRCIRGWGFPLCLAFLFAVCDRSDHGPSEHRGEESPGEGKVFIWVKGIRIAVEVSDTPESRASGLMFREELAPDEGMLFVLDREQYLSFWMKDTQIPLSIAFMDRTGTILQTEDMTPFDTETLHRSSRPALYALEMNRGWFERNGVKVGDKVEFSGEAGAWRCGGGTGHFALVFSGRGVIFSCVAETDRSELSDWR